MKQTLIKMMNDLSDELVNMGTMQQTLKDVQLKFSEVRSEMDMVNTQDPSYHLIFIHHHHSIRILDDLVGYVVKEMKDKLNRLNEMNGQMLKMTRNLTCNDEGSKDRR